MLCNIYVTACLSISYKNMGISMNMEKYRIAKVRTGMGKNFCTTAKIWKNGYEQKLYQRWENKKQSKMQGKR